MLVLFFYENKACDLQEALEALTKMVDESLNDIWNTDQDRSSTMVSNNAILSVAFVCQRIFVFILSKLSVKLQKLENCYTEGNV